MRLQGVRVLLVEDHRDTLDMMCMVLGHEGAQTDCVCTADDGLRAAQTLRPDVIVADLAVADDRLKLVPAIRAAVGDHVPAICVTAHVQSEDVDRAKRAGFEVHLAKPIAPDTLVKTIERMARIGRA